MPVETVLLLASLLSVIVAALGGVFGYLYQGHRNAKDKDLAGKQGHYIAILSNVFKLLYVEPGISCAQVLNEIEKSWFYASDNVLRKVYAVVEVHNKLLSHRRHPILVLRDNPTLKAEFDRALQQLFVSMRRDLRVGSGLLKWFRRPKWPAAQIELYPAGVLAEPTARLWDPTKFNVWPDGEVQNFKVAKCGSGQ